MGRMTKKTDQQMSLDDISQYIMDMPDEVLEKIKFSMPWQYSDVSIETKDSDGFPIVGADKKDDTAGARDALQDECFRKFHRNPHVNTAIRGLVGRLTGFGFETTSEVFEIQEAIDEIEEDPRNRLWYFWPKYVGRFNIEGELFLSLTLHTDGFVEIDFIDPAVVVGGGDNGSGIIFHPDKPQMPLFYVISKDKNKVAKQLIPSIYIARYPKLVKVAEKIVGFDSKLANKSRSRANVYNKVGGFKRFIIANDRGFITRRAVSYLRTTLEWLNHYEDLKKYEIDHKKSSGSYTWVFSFEDVRSFKTWLTLTDEEKRKTAVGAKMTPGAKLVLPPGMTLECKNPNLTSIKDQDTDILHMIAGGLNEPEDILTGAAQGPYSSIKASRGPMSDRISDEVAYWKRWLIFEFWSSVFFLKSVTGKFEKFFRNEEAIGFDKDKEPIFKKIKRKPEKLIELSFPVSEATAYQERARAMLGVKHGPMAETVGIPNSLVAANMGFGSYGRNRLRKATEDNKYPELLYAGGVDAEALQETMEGEKPKPTVKKEAPKKQLVKRKNK